MDWLRVFAASAANENFVLAARKLGVTPGAISQRIKALEEFLDVVLFERRVRGVRLTEIGRRYAARVVPALDQISTATREIASAEDSRPIRLTILPALAQLWLGPRMARFDAPYGSASIEVWADAAVHDLRTSNFDIAIRHGRPPFAGCDHRELFYDKLVPVASPVLLKKCEVDKHGLPVDAPLMLDSHWRHDFEYWLTKTGKTRPRGVVTQSFSLYSMMVEAALNGLGFMVGHTALIGNLIAQGRLVPLSDKRVPSTNQFYLLTREGQPLSEFAESFMRWILSEAALDENDKSTAAVVAPGP